MGRREDILRGHDAASAPMLVIYKDAGHPGVFVGLKNTYKSVIYKKKTTYICNILTTNDPIFSLNSTFAAYKKVK